MTETAAKATTWNDRRLYARSHVILNGRLRGGIEEQDCMLLDLSASGAMVRLSDPAPSPAHVAVTTEHFGELRGRVIWQMHNVIGLRFADRPQQVARIVQAAAPHLRLAS
ncbi:MAG TPA: PilZ domain-containing protein [Kiloniellales bacterium]